MNSRKIQLIINSLLIILEIIGFILVINELGVHTLEYYTEDSNFLLLVSSVILLIYLISNKEAPSWFKSLRYIAVVSTTLTLLIVLTVLSWTTDWGLNYLLFHGSMLYHHTLCPIIALLSFIMIENYEDLNPIHGLYFTIAYGLVMIVLNILKIVNGPYPFLQVNNQPIIVSIFWIIIIYAITFAISVLLKKGNGKVII